MPNPDTDEWVIQAYMDYQPRHKWKKEPCNKCDGTGMIGGGFKSLDDPSKCWDCNGKGEIDKLNVPLSNKPKQVPQELLDHIRKAYLEYKLK